MKKAFFPMHLGCGNRGCEGIIRGTSEILKLEEYQVVLFERDEEEKEKDTFLGISVIGKLCTYRGKKDIKNPLELFVYKVVKKLGNYIKLFGLIDYRYILKNVTENDVVFFTGGDLYCYPGYVKINTWLNEELRKKNVKTVLWGASVTNDFFTPKVVQQLKNYTQITCRETYSLENLKRAGIVENVQLYPDPAFVLKAKKIELPLWFAESEVVGINISNFVGGSYNLDTIFGKNVIKLVEYIINNTKYNILLVPHVTWAEQDDRIMCEKLYLKFKETGRVNVLQVDDIDYCSIRYIISKCKFFFGARTHAVISAYATCVPTIALGYSIKSRGIAHDLGLDEFSVLNCKQLSTENEMIERFKYLEENEKQIKEHLQKRIPNYINQAQKAKDALSAIL